jgi:hypothetical protein
MPRQRDFKRLVRARMQKTGEAYTSARARLLAKPRPATRSRPTQAPPPPDYAQLAGMSDAVIKEKTGCTWARWVKALDRHGAERMSHREIARLVSTTSKIGGWWSQAVTVGYERIKGLRARGQRRDGSYEASKSRTFGVPVSTLFTAWADAGVRRRWLDADGVRVRTATGPKSMRLGWTDGTIVTIWFTPKGETKSSVAVQHTQLADAASAARLTRYWSERLDALGEVLAEP